MAFPEVVTERMRARGRRAVALERAREYAPQTFAALCFLAAVVISGLVSR